MANDKFDGLEHTLKQISRAIRGGPRIPVEPGGDMDPDVTASIIGRAFHAAGYKTRLKAVRQDDMFGHVFIEVYDPLSREWVPIDPQRTTPMDWKEERIHPV